MNVTDFSVKQNTHNFGPVSLSVTIQDICRSRLVHEDSNYWSTETSKETSKEIQYSNQQQYLSWSFIPTADLESQLRLGA